jgi:acetyl-CoA synthetase
MSQFAWQPDPEIVARARLAEFLRRAGGTEFADLYERSITDIEWFTESVLNFLDVRFQAPYSSVLDLSRGREWPLWCADGKLNIVESCVRHHPAQAAVISETECGGTRTLTYAELRHEVSHVAAGLRSLGIQKGDRVGIYMPMSVETVVVLLAIGWIGAVAVPLFSGYGPAAIRTRLNQTHAKALIAHESFQKSRKRIQMIATAEEALERCPTVQHLIVVPGSADVSARVVPWKKLLESGETPSERTSPEDPLIIIFSSGTTGEPKGIVHSHISFPVKSAQDMSLQMDVHSGEHISWITDLGWMMGPWLIYGALILGATAVLYDGACDWPGPGRLWDFTARHRLNVLGVSPSLVRRLAEHGAPESSHADLSHLRFFASSGEPWDHASWWWLFQNVRRKPVPIINYSGGTEISGGILSNHPLAPMKPCGFAAPCLGIAADVVDEAGNSVSSGVGELSIRRPWIGQARGFWGDPERYLQTYWSRVPGLWMHGDWAERDRDGCWFIHGRSDDTLKIGGKRVGPAEVESILISHPSVVEAAVIGIPDQQKGTALVGICVGSQEDAPPETLREFVAKELGKPLRPDRIHFVTALPKTRNGKIVRRAIRAAYLHEDAGDISALENPGVLEEIRKLNM